MTRIAHVTNAERAERLWRYLPGNYAILLGIDGEYLIAGQDRAGWTLDDYVIPRLASGLIWCKEVEGEELLDLLRKLGPFGDLD